MNGQMWHRVAVVMVMCGLVVVVSWVAPAGLPVWLVLALAAGAYVLVVYRPAELVRLLEAAGRLPGRLSGCLSSVQLAA
ncbi:hypothetical protein [Nocardioides sp. NPDC006273]|uniref:hypothetical protein n=1 Tax=Nocardioides sp. NPDC006273 TaxID=3155598 RepID=UPI0033A8F41C